MPAHEAPAEGAAGMPGEGDDGGDLLEQVARMTELARRGEWQRIESLAAGIIAMAGRLPAGGQGSELNAAKAGIEGVTTLATAARNEIAEKLSAIRHGRKAMASYRATGTLSAR